MPELIFHLQWSETYDLENTGSTEPVPAPAPASSSSLPPPFFKHCPFSCHHSELYYKNKIDYEYIERLIWSSNSYHLS